MQTVDTVIEARWVIPVVPKGLVLERHSVIVQEGRILDVLPTEDARCLYKGCETQNLKNHAVMPGFVNLHSHAAMNLLRGMGADLRLMDWLTKEIWPTEGKLMSDAFVDEGSFLAGVEMAASGITCTSDCYFFPNAAARGLRRAGLRCAVTGIVIGFPSAWAADDEEYLAKAEALLEETKDPFVHITVGPHAPYTVSDASLARCAELSERYNAPIHIHVGETANEVEESLAKYGERPLERLNRLGLVNERLISVHSVHSSESDIELLARAGSSVCHCPCSNLKLASGFAPVAAYMKAGVNVGIGTDGAASNDKLDMLGETRLAAMLAKAVAGDTTAATVPDMLYAATMGGARALHWDDEIGSIEKGKSADLIAIDLSGPNVQPVSDAGAQLLYAADRSDITHTWVAGRLIYQIFEGERLWPTAGISRADAQAIAEKWQNRR